MSRIASYLVVLCFILLSRGIIHVNTGEPQHSTNDVEITSSSADVQNLPPSDSVETFTDQLLDLQVLPQEPYPHVIEEFNNDEATDHNSLVPPTSTVGDIHVLNMGAGGVAGAASLDIQGTSSMDPTGQAVDYTADTSVRNGVSKTDQVDSDIEKTRDGEKSSSSALEGSQVVVNSETAITSSEPSTVFGGAKGGEPVADIHLPAINKILEDIMQTQIYDPDRVYSSQPLPSSEESSYTFHMPGATEALKSVQPGTWTDMSKLPAGLGEKEVDAHFKVDGVVPTQFSLEDEDGKKKTGEEDFPTFDKWSMQYLAEQEKQKVKKQQEQAVNQGTLPVQKKLRRNFAAKSCGAKVVASNPEAENVNFVLNKNPDEYMLSPCKSKKWFVVELCEPLQIHKVDLGTTELFASQPKSFRLSASQRYPTKEWMPIGKFDMTSDRTIQSFSTQVNEEFVKFVRVEMLEHHGDEYYCPVTTFRVLGVDMASDEDDENHNHSVDSDDEAAVVDSGEDEIEESVNLFTSAKDVVVKLVKKVLFKEQEEDIVKEERAAVDNATTKADEKKGDSAPCSDKSKASVVDDSPTVHIPEPGIISHSPASEEPKVVPIVTKLADTEQLPQVTVETPLIIKLDKDADVGPWECALCHPPELCICSPWNMYLQMMAHVHQKSATCPKLFSELVTDNSLSNLEGTITSTDSFADHTTSLKYESEESHHEQFSAGTVVPKQDVLVESDLNEEDHMQQKSSSQNEMGQSSATSSQRLPLDNAAKTISSKGHQQKSSEEPVVASHLTSFSSSEVTVTRSETLDPSSLFSHTEVEDVAMSLMTPDLDIQQSQVVEQGTNNLAETIFLKVSPTPTLTSEDSMEVDEDILPESPTADQQTDMKPEEHMSQLPFNGDLLHGRDGHLDGQGVQNISRSQDKNDTSPTSGKTTKSIDLVDVSVSSSSSSKKDTSIMKLNNRIMALEQNVSMTKKYLEELSRAFKQQNEDMMKLLNKTEKRLTSYISQSEERELRQQAHIDILELKVSNLTQVVDSLQLQMNALGKELRGAQFLLVVFQAVLFLWLIITSYRGRSKSPLVYTDHQFLLDTMPTKPSFERSEKGIHQRRNSDVGLQSGVEQTGSSLKRQTSEANLASFGGNKQQQNSVDGGTAFLRDTAQVSKKRKKKKLKHHQLSVDSGSTLNAALNNGSFPTQSSSFSSSAGVLFGTNSSFRAEEIVPAGGSLLEASSKVSSNVIFRNNEELDGYPQSNVHHAPPYVAPVNTRHGILVLKNSVNGQSISNSAVSTAPKFNGGVRFSWSGSLPGVNRVPSTQFNGHHSISEAGFSTTPLKDSTESVISVTASPEFKIPRNKIRKVAENSSSDHQGFSGGKSFSGAEEFKRRRSAGFINPKAGQEFFLAENYMSENRFKFPLSPANDASLDLSSRKSADIYEFGTGFTTNGSGLDEICPLQSSGPFQPFSTKLYKGQPHYKSASSLPIASSSSSTQTSRLQSPPQTPSFIPLHPTTTQGSFISTEHIPLPLSQLSSKSLIGASSRRGSSFDHSAQLIYHSSAQILEPGPVISPGLRSSQSAPRIDTHTSSQIKGNTSHLDGSTDIYQSHRRQGSLPTNQLQPQRSSEKESPPCTRKSTFEGSKQLGKPTSGNLQGPRLKRLPPNPSSFSKRSSGNKTSNSDGTSHQAFTKRGS